MNETVIYVNTGQGKILGIFSPAGVSLHNFCAIAKEPRIQPPRHVSNFVQSPYGKFLKYTHALQKKTVQAK